MLKNAKLYRNAVRGFLVALAVGGFQISAHAIKKADMGSFRYTTSPTGKVVSVNPNQAGQSGSLGSIPPGQVGSQIGNSGWYVGTSASGNPSTGQTMHVGHKGDVFFAGTKYPFQAGYQVPKASLLDALVLLCKTPVTCAAALAAGPMLEWAASGKVSANPNAADYPEKPFQRPEFSDGYRYRAGTGDQPWAGSADLACRAWMQRVINEYSNAGYGNVSGSYGVGSMCTGTVTLTEPGQTRPTSYYVQRALQSEPWNNEQNLPRSMDDIAPYMDLPATPEKQAELFRDFMDKGADIPLGQPTVTGPTSIPTGKTTTQNPDGTTTTTQTTNNYRTEGNTITNTTTVTTTQTCTGAGSCSTTTTTNENPPEEKPPEEEEEQDECKKNPDSLLCADLDTPGGDIPKTEKNLTYQEQDVFGGGSCPANVYVNIRGQQVKAYDWGQTCGVVSTYLRPIILLLGAMSALFILIPGRDA